jgi:hypothetical protein
MTEQRHAYIVSGISRETFTAIAENMTMEDSELEYMIHDHTFLTLDNKVVDCSSTCEMIRSGEKYVRGWTPSEPAVVDSEL